MIAKEGLFIAIMDPDPHFATLNTHHISTSNNKKN